MSDSFVTRWTVARQAPLSGDFTGKNTGADYHSLLQGIFRSRLSFPSPGDLPASGSESASPALAARFLPSEPAGKHHTSQFSSVAQSCPTLCDSGDCSTPGLAVHHQLVELAQTQVHQVSDAIQPSHPLSSLSPPAFNLSQHQGLFQ